MRIGEMAAEAGVTPKTLRFYETQGLLDPPARTDAGYREYGPETRERLAFIRSARSSGLTLAEIRGIIAFRDRGEAPCAHVIDLIRDRTLQVDRQIAQLRALKQGLGELAGRAEHLDPGSCDPAAVCSIISTAQ